MSTPIPAANEPKPLMTRGEVAHVFRVCDKTPNRWAKAGLITQFHTPGGKPRYLRAEIEALLARGYRTPPFLKGGVA